MGPARVTGNPEFREARSWFSTSNVKTTRILAAVYSAEQERARISERTRAGLARARAAGKKLGRRPRRDRDRLLPQVRVLRAQGLGIRAIARRLRIPPATVADWASENVAPGAEGSSRESGAPPTAAA